MEVAAAKDRLRHKVSSAFSTQSRCIRRGSFQLGCCNTDMPTLHNSASAVSTILNIFPVSTSRSVAISDTQSMLLLVCRGDSRCYSSFKSLTL